MTSDTAKMLSAWSLLPKPNADISGCPNTFKPCKKKNITAKRYNTLVLSRGLNRLKVPKETLTGN